MIKARLCQFCFSSPSPTLIAAWQPGGCDRRRPIKHRLPRRRRLGVGLGWIHSVVHRGAFIAASALHRELIDGKSNWSNHPCLIAFVICTELYRALLLQPLGFHSLCIQAHSLPETYKHSAVLLVHLKVTRLCLTLEGSCSVQVSTVEHFHGRVRDTVILHHLATPAPFACHKPQHQEAVRRRGPAPRGNLV